MIVGFMEMRRGYLVDGSRSWAGGTWSRLEFGILGQKAIAEKKRMGQSAQQRFVVYTSGSI